MLAASKLMASPGYILLNAHAIIIKCMDIASGHAAGKYIGTQIAVVTNIAVCRVDATHYRLGLILTSTVILGLSGLSSFRPTFTSTTFMSRFLH